MSPVITQIQQSSFYVRLLLTYLLSRFTSRYTMLIQYVVQTGASTSTFSWCWWLVFALALALLSPGNMQC